MSNVDKWLAGNDLRKPADKLYLSDVAKELINQYQPNNVEKDGYYTVVSYKTFRVHCMAADSASNWAQGLYEGPDGVEYESKSFKWLDSISEYIAFDMVHPKPTATTPTKDKLNRILKEENAEKLGIVLESHPFSVRAFFGRFNDKHFVEKVPAGIVEVSNRRGSGPDYTYLLSDDEVDSYLRWLVRDEKRYQEYIDTSKGVDDDNDLLDALEKVSR